MAQIQASLAFLRLSEDQAEPLYRQLYQQLRQAVLEGQLDPGTKLPASRDLAQRLTISRNTVVNAYAQLRAEGYLSAQVGSGTYISRQLPEHVSQVTAAREWDDRRVEVEQAELSERGIGYVERAPAADSGHPFRSPDRVFTIGIPDLASFPFETWRRIQSRVLREQSPWEFGYQPPQGYGPLRQAVAAHLKAARGVRCRADDILISSGSQQGLFLAATVLLDPGDEVWVEEPGYSGAHNALKAAGAVLRRIPLDEAGLDLAAGLARWRPPKLIYLTPSHQFPTGVTMPLHRRLALLEFAEKAGVWLLEDDYDSEYRYAGRPIPALQGLDGRGRVIYLGSFSKVLFPGLRLGYVAAPRLLTKAMSSARQAQDLHPPVLAQSILAEFIQSGEFGRHLRRLRVLNGKRAQALEAGLRRGLADRLQVPPIEAGLHLTLPLPARVSDWQAAGAAIEHEVQATPLSVYRAVPGGEPGLVLGFGAARVAAIEAGAARLCQALNPLLD